MNEVKKDNTEAKILEAAKTVFIKKGMDGSRMQEIADEAGINKALLHYYFRSKQKLFEAIFKQVFKQLFPNIREFIQSEKPIQHKLATFIDSYISLLLRNPFLPTFLLKEMHREPEFVASLIKSQGINPQELFAMFEKEMKAGNIRKTDPRDLMINMLSLSIFPFAAKPLFQVMFFNNDKKAYNQFLKDRKVLVKNFILDAILIKN